MAKRPRSNTQAAQIRTYINEHPGASRIDFNQDTGLNVTSSRFCQVRTDMHNKKMHAKIESTNAVTPQIQQQLKEIETKLDEYRYRCWKLEGEKFGYTQRLHDEKTTTV